MKNLSQLMKTAQEAQERMANMQAELEALEVTGESAAGMVRVVMTGKGRAVSLSIDPSLVDPNDAGVLEDLIVAAINDAKTKIDAEKESKMKDLTGGLPLPPGMSLPF